MDFLSIRYKVISFLKGLTKHTGYLSWLVYMGVLSLILFNLVLSVQYKIVFYFPPTALNLLLILLVLLLTGLYVNYIGLDYFLLSKVRVASLFLFPLLLIGYGFYAGSNSGKYSYRGTQVTEQVSILSPLRQDVPQQIFEGTQLSEGQNAMDTSQPFHEGKKVYIFYRLGCAYCQASIPVVLEGLSERQKRQIVFLDLDHPMNHLAANQLGVAKASTLVTYQPNSDGSWKRKVTPLASGSSKRPDINIEAINLIAALTK